MLCRPHRASLSQARVKMEMVLVLVRSDMDQIKGLAEGKRVTAVLDYCDLCDVNTVNSLGVSVVKNN